MVWGRAQECGRIGWTGVGGGPQERVHAGLGGAGRAEKRVAGLLRRLALLQNRQAVLRIFRDIRVLLGDALAVGELLDKGHGLAIANLLERTDQNAGLFLSAARKSGVK